MENVYLIVTWKYMYSTCSCICVYLCKIRSGENKSSKGAYNNSLVCNFYITHIYIKWVHSLQHFVLYFPVPCFGLDNFLSPIFQCLVSDFTIFCPLFSSALFRTKWHNTWRHITMEIRQQIWRHQHQVCQLPTPRSEGEEETQERRTSPRNIQ